MTSQSMGGKTQPTNQPVPKYSLARSENSQKNYTKRPLQIKHLFKTKTYRSMISSLCILFYFVSLVTKLCLIYAIFRVVLTFVNISI